jgi:hypothetical protein
MQCKLVSIPGWRVPSGHLLSIRTDHHLSAPARGV